MKKLNSIIYWIATIWLALGMVATGIPQLLKLKGNGDAPPAVDGIVHLGYPVYFLTILSIAKMLGVVAILVPRYPLLKEWAYAGFFFIMTGAVYSHIASGDAPAAMIPSVLLLVLTVVSWYFRPVSRKLYPSLNKSIA